MTETSVELAPTSGDYEPVASLITSSPALCALALFYVTYWSVPAVGEFVGSFSGTTYTLGEMSLSLPSAPGDGSYYYGGQANTDLLLALANELTGGNITRPQS